MSLEVIEKVTQVENETRERKVAAEAEAKKIVAEAEREGLALLQRVRAEAADSGGRSAEAGGGQGCGAGPPGLQPPRRRRRKPCGRRPAGTWRKRLSLLSEGL